MLIVISGKARSGKDTASFILQKVLEKHFNVVYYTRAYADDLKEMLMRDLNLTYEQVYGDLKEEPDLRYPKEDGTFWTPREFLQYFGTDVYRKIDPLFWVKKLQKYVENNGSNCIITDARFVNEVDWVKSLGGIYLDVERSFCGAKQGKRHLSETSLDNFQSDYTVMNNSDSVKYLEMYIIDEIIPVIIKKLNGDMSCQKKCLNSSSVQVK
jgi:hypothetical protein